MIENIKRTSRYENMIIFIIIFSIFQPYITVLNKKFTLLYLIIPIIFLYMIIKKDITVDLNCIYKNSSILDKIFIMFILAIGVSLAITPKRINGLIWLSVWIIYFLIFYMVSFSRYEINLKKLINTYLISSIVISLIGIVQYIYVMHIASWEVFRDNFLNSIVGKLIYSENVVKAISVDGGNWLNYTTGQVNFRAVSIFNGPAGNGMISGTFILLSIILLYYGNKNKLIYISLFLTSINFMLTFSRSSWVGFGVASLLILIMLIKKYKKNYHENKHTNKKGLIIILIGILAITIFAMFEIGLFDKFIKVFSTIFDPNEMSNRGRLGIWVDNFKLFIGSPIIGYGIGSYDEVFRKFLGLAPAMIQYTAHNAYMLFMIELGGIGAGLFIALLLTPIKYAFKLSKEKLNEKYFLVFTVFMLVLISVQFIFDYDFNNTRFIPIWMINIGIINRMIKRYRYEKSNM